MGRSMRVVGGGTSVTKRMGIAAAVSIMVIFGLGFPASSSAGVLIQPGEYMEIKDSACTLSFVYDGGGAVYIGTAAHCVDHAGDDVKLSDGTVFGDVAAIGDEDETETDWALIKVRPDHVQRVNPSVKGHPMHPTGVTTSSETHFGDLVQQSGYGLGFGMTQPTREERRSALTYDDARLFSVLGASIHGDSGGPIVHIPTGKALGIVSRLCLAVPPCQMEGPTVEGIVAQAADKGVQITLRPAASTSTTSSTSSSSTTSTTTKQKGNGNGKGGGGGKPSRSDNRSG